MKIINSFIAICLFVLPVSAQIAHFECGTPSDMDMERLMANLEAASTLEARAGVQYLPVTMTLIANDDGSGLITEDAALNGFCRLNENFEDLGIQFYLHDGFRYVYDSDFYLINGPGSQNPASLKIPNTINIFVSEVFTQGAQGSCSGILGFYSPANDYVAIDKCTMDGASFALTHELGHFFSLPHTFFGWENQSYNPNQPTPEFVNGVRVEYADESNCSISADRICDTPPDYNFGLGAGGCDYSGGAVDPAGNAVDPDEMNYMGYFFNCPSHNFSPNQGDVIHADIADRTFVSGSPVTTAVNGQANLTYPIDAEITPNTDVTLTWDAVDGATTYLIELNRVASFSPSFVVQRTVVTTNSLALEDLLPNTNYHWRVRPFNESYTCTDYGAGTSFKTGELVNVVQIEGVESLNIYPNPSNGVENIFMEVNTSEALEAEIKLYNTQGKLVQVLNHQFNSGANSVKIKTESLSQGAYIIGIQTENGTTHQRIFITR